MHVHIDFETFSLLSVKEVGAYRYAEDPSTEVLICCYALGDGPVRTWLPHRDRQIPTELADAVARGAYLCAHNAQFERAVWELVLRKKHGAPRTRRGQWVCTAVLSAQAGLPRSLDGATVAINVPHKKNPDGDKLIKVFCGPRKPTKSDPTTRILPKDRPEDFRRFMVYCRDDVEAERALFKRLPPLPPVLQRVFEHDMRINERGLPIDIDTVKLSLPIVEELTKWASDRTLAITGSIKPTQVAKLRDWINCNGWELPNLQRTTLETEIVNPDMPPDIRDLLEIRMEAGLVSHKKFYAMLRVCSPRDHRARGTILMYGAHTGRWSGKLIQPHNFKRGNWASKQAQLMDYAAMFDALRHGDADLIARLWPNPIAAISMCMRGFIMAPEGRKLRVVDYSAIEARVLAWLAGEQWLLDAFRRGLDVYKVMASMLYNVHYDNVTSEQRRISKNLVLGCGYQLGARNFVTYCARNGLFVTEEQSAEAVGTYRARNKRIVSYWYEVERAAIAAVQTGQRVQAGHVAFEVQDVWLTVLLPSGRRLYYPYPKVQVAMAYGKPKLQLSFREEFKGSMIRQTTYGGKMVENITQAVAMDLLANGVDSAEDRGFEIVGTVHDELINEDDVSDNKTIKDFEHAVCVLPDWARGVPIGAEGFETIRYRKG